MMAQRNEIVGFVTESLAVFFPDGPEFGRLLGYMIVRAREIGRETDVNICGEIAGNIDARRGERIVVCMF